MKPSIFFGFISAALWIWAALVKIPPKTYEDFGPFERALKKMSYLNAAAAVASALAIFATAFSN